MADVQLTDLDRELLETIRSRFRERYESMRVVQEMLMGAETFEQFRPLLEEHLLFTAEVELLQEGLERFASERAGVEEAMTFRDTISDGFNNLATGAGSRNGLYDLANAHIISSS